MDEKLTPQQREAVFNRGGPLLVSAAAGSGKTKVLVDRLLSYLTDPVNPVNIDDFLIITYTKAAASELRGKISAIISERIAGDPHNRHLQQQMQRLYLAKISTVHAFCADILRENAHMLDISADFRVADENECVAIQANILQNILEEAYDSAQNNPDFCAFIDSQGFGRDDRQASEIILRVYHSAMCHLNPDAWLDRIILSSATDTITDAAQTIWGQYLLEDLQTYLDLHISAIKRCVERASIAVGMEKPCALLNSTLDQLVVLRNSHTWNDVCKNMDIDYGRLVFSKQCTDVVLIAQIKAVREACKKGINAKLRRFAGTSAQALEDMTRSTGAVCGLVSLVRNFKSAYNKAKQSRHIMDFSDLEQKTLDLLLGKQRTQLTSISRELGQRFKEVLVDEYQDSNEVQDAIFSALTARDGNCFMVGDVKQSIYQFRLADPGIFLEKYNSFLPVEEARDGQGRKVLLSSNFRSSAGVISAVNDVFTHCMSPYVGGLVYGDEEILCEGIPHVSLPDEDVEFYGIHVENDTYQEEAAFVAEKVTELLDGTHVVRDGEKLRPIVPDDIVILLRSPGSVGYEFQCALQHRGIQCVSGSGTDLLQTEEVQTLISILHAVNNPLQDIYLTAAMMSRVFCFSADEMAELRGSNKSGSIYSSVCSSTSPKVRAFLETLSVLRRKAQTNTLTEFLNNVFSFTRIDSIYASVDDGPVRTENLQNLLQIAASCESMGLTTLGRFLDYLSSIKERGLVVGGEQTGVGAVTIMSIHKSKGLEFPVVFLCGLSRDFNTESSRAQVLCDKMLGLGLSCVDSQNRVRYPSVAKRAIATKINAEGLSEEMRVLYVAMTRAKDRLIMTYAARNINEEISELSHRLALSEPVLLTLDARCPGDWVLLTSVICQGNGWQVKLVSAPHVVHTVTGDIEHKKILSLNVIDRLKEAHAFIYPHIDATQAPSKQTATQLKGRTKDSEAAEYAQSQTKEHRAWRKPSFVEEGRYDPTTYGTIMHLVMQHLRFSLCTNQQAILGEIERLISGGYISKEQAELIHVDQIEAFFNSEFGMKLRASEYVLREFKFSVLDDAAKYDPDITNEEILLQGVVDCAIVDDDGIEIIDFKTDRVTADTFEAVADGYIKQIKAYAYAMSKIYRRPIKKAMLYFFAINRFVEIN